ncbi:MAG TPA: 3-dehydroquinate synthase family protein, partial [Burkholderiaceae bacterium]|nr:3-dehydroquinate synthase family protein [Burkholderiaceae bacterium]
GVRYVQVPTTLLAQVDSSVGGKTGINHPRGKNLIGAFHQPSSVVSDTDTLKTLAPRELSAGLAEILKHGLVADADYFERMVSAIDSMRAGDAVALAGAIAGSCEIKASIVARDEKEAGERALLNLGHTFGHAIEAMTGYSRWLHGEAVGCGLVLAAKLSRAVGSLAASDVQRISAAVARAGLPTRVDSLSALEAIETMRVDKKTDAGQTRFVVLERIGKASQRTVPQSVLLETLTASGFL